MDIKTFDVLAAVKGRSYPTDSVTVYTDIATLYAYNAMDGVANDADDANDVDSLTAALVPLREAMQASALTFHMRGFAQEAATSMNDEASAKFGEGADLDDGDAFVWRMDRYIAASIIKVVNAEGAVDEHLWQVDDVEVLRGYLAEEEFAKLIALMLRLSFSAWQFDAAITADFS